jgi:hypothetical protein
VDPFDSDEVDVGAVDLGDADEGDAAEAGAGSGMRAAVGATNTGMMRYAPSMHAFAFAAPVRGTSQNGYARTIESQTRSGCWLLLMT